MPYVHDSCSQSTRETCGGLELNGFGGTTVVSELSVVAISPWKFVLFSCTREGKGGKEEN